MEEKQPAEETVQICREQGEVDRSGTGFLYDDWHEAVETKHAGTKADVEQAWGERGGNVALRTWVEASELSS